MHRSDGATALLDTPGFVVGAQLEVDDEWWLSVETTAHVVRCPACGTRAVGHGRRRVKVRDLPIAGRRVVVVWAKRISRFADADCDTGSWNETSDAIAPGAVLTERARAEICRRVGKDEDSVAEVARDFGVGWHAAMAAVRSHGTPARRRSGALRGRRGARPGRDPLLGRHAYPPHEVRHRLREPRLRPPARRRPGRSAKSVEEWLGERPSEWLAGIDVVALDPFRGYANGLLDHLGHATVVVDHFHALRLANKAIDDARRRTQNECHEEVASLGDSVLCHQSPTPREARQPCS